MRCSAWQCWCSQRFSLWDCVLLPCCRYATQTRNSGTPAESASITVLCAFSFTAVSNAVSPFGRPPAAMIATDTAGGARVRSATLSGYLLSSPFSCTAFGCASINATVTAAATCDKATDMVAPTRSRLHNMQTRIATPTHQIIHINRNRGRASAESESQEPPFREQYACVLWIDRAAKNQARLDTNSFGYIRRSIHICYGLTLLWKASAMCSG